MKEAEFIGYTVLSLGALVTIVVPILRLNSSIVSLTTMLNNLIKDGEERDKRLESHANRIIQMNETISRHDTDLKSHEKRIRLLEEYEHERREMRREN